MIKEISKTPFVVSGKRNSHGTRMAHRIECKRCHKEDFVPARPKAGKDLFCKTCAAQHLGILEEGMRIVEQKVKVKCSNCRLPFDAEIRLLDKPDLLCKNCFKGFEIWRGSRLSSSDKGSSSLEKRNGQTVLRRKATKKILPRNMTSLS